MKAKSPLQTYFIFLMLQGSRTEQKGLVLYSIHCIAIRGYVVQLSMESCSPSKRELAAGWVVRTLVPQELGQEDLSHPCRALSCDSAGFHLSQYLLHSVQNFILWSESSDVLTFPYVLYCWYSLVCEPAQAGHRNNHNTMDEMERRFGFVETKPQVLPFWFSP